MCNLPFGILRIYKCNVLLQEESVVLNVPLGVITHIEKIGRSRQKGDNVIYGLDVHCKVRKTLASLFIAYNCVCIYHLHVYLLSPFLFPTPSPSLCLSLPPSLLFSLCLSLPLFFLSLPLSPPLISFSVSLGHEDIEVCFCSQSRVSWKKRNV